MKKIIACLLLASSSIAFADNAYDVVENKLELKYQTMTDSNNNTMHIDDIDVKSLNGNIYVTLEMEPMMGDGGWSRFNKTSYKKIATQIADEVRMYTQNQGKVEINLVKEDNITDKKTLLDSAFY